MLNFFRRYQKFFFIIICIVIVISFSFFGTYSAIMQTDKIPDKEVAKATDGSSIMHSDVETLHRFLATSALDISLIAQNKMPNLLNDGVIEKDFVESGIASLLASRYPGEMKLDWESCLRRAKHFHPCAEEWLGSRFLELSAHFIINAALLAEQRGYSISNEEIKTEFAEILGEQLVRLGQPVEQPGNYLLGQLRYIGLDESQFLKVGKRILLFRRLFNDIGNAVFLDPLLHRDFSAFAKKAVQVDLYQLPKELCFTEFSDLLKFQVYLETVASPSFIQGGGSPLALPKTFRPAEEVEKLFPQLVEKRFLVEYVEVNKEDLALEVSLKNTWDWELEEDHWEILTHNFPILLSSHKPTREERFAILENLEGKLRFDIDHFVRQEIIAAHPEWIEEALQKADPTQELLRVGSEGAKLPFKGISNPKEFCALLEMAPLKEEREPSPIALSVADKLHVFSADNQHFYAISVVERAKEKNLLTYDEAVRAHILDGLLEKRLEGAYAELRKKYPQTFRKEGSSWKPLAEVKEEVGSRLFADLLQAIGEGLPETPAYYASHRFFSYLKEAKDALAFAGTQESWLQTKEETTPTVQAPPLDEQWRLIKTAKTIGRGTKMPLSFEELFAFPENSWSHILSTEDAGVCFFHFQEHIQPEGIPSEDIKNAQELLAKEARLHLANTLLEKGK